MVPNNRDLRCILRPSTEGAVSAKHVSNPKQAFFQPPLYIVTGNIHNGSFFRCAKRAKGNTIGAKGLMRACVPSRIGIASTTL